MRETIHTRHWELSYRSDPLALALADRHYSRQSVGSNNMMPPGRCIVLVGDQCVWGSSLQKYVMHEWAGAIVCTIFRNEGQILSSVLILEAVAITSWKWQIPEQGMITFVNKSKVIGKRDFGYCFLKAGFNKIGHTKSGLVALHLARDSFPEPFNPTNQTELCFPCIES